MSNMIALYSFGCYTELANDVTMYKLFEDVLINKNDSKKLERLALLEELNYPNSAEFIVDNLTKIFCN